MKNSNNIRLYSWFLILCVAFSYLLLEYKHGIKVESSIIKLLPHSEYDATTENAVKSITSNIGKKIVFLLGNEDKSKALESADLFNSKLEKSHLFSQINYILSSDFQKETWLTYFPFRNKLLSENYRQLLQQGHDKTIVENALRRLYSPMGALAGKQLENDAFFTFQDFLEQQSRLVSNLKFDNNRLWSEYKGKHYILITVDIRGDTFSLDTQNQFNTFYGNTKAIIKSNIIDTDILSMGAIHHASAGTSSAKYEITTIGTGSLLCILILILVIFKSITPILLSLISIASGILTGLTSCLLIYNEIHIFTLVFGSSLIGVSIDYSFHYFAEQLQSSDNKKSIHNIFNGISMGALTSIMAYLALAIAPFPGLRQIAVFSATGLIASYLCVLIVYPAIKNRLHREISPGYLAQLKKIIMLWQNIPQNILHFFIFFSILVTGTLTYSQLQTDDNIRNLQSRSPAIMAEDSLVKNIIRANGENQFFLIRGSDEEENLQLEELLFISLNKLISEDKLEAYQSAAVYIPSKKRQLENYHLLQNSINRDNSLFKKYLHDIGYSSSATTSFLSQFNINEDTLNLSDWLTTQFAAQSAFHWIGRSDISNDTVSLVSLYGIKDISSLQRLTLPENIQFIDYVEDISSLLKRYREYAGILIVSAYILIFILLLFRYGWYNSILIISPPLIATLSALSIALFIGIKLHYFNSLAIILVLGIGIDYSLFFAENRGRPELTMLAIILSALTTIFAFGLLALSDTPVLQSFGILVFTGILFAFILSPIAGFQHKSTSRHLVG